MFKSPTHLRSLEIYNASTTAARSGITEEALFNLQPLASEIRKLGGAQTESAVKIGQYLTEAATTLKEGRQFLAWVRLELPDFSQKTVDNYRSAYAFCQKHNVVNYTTLPVSAVYELARADKAAPEVINRVLDKARNERVTLKEVRDTIRKGVPGPEKVQKKSDKKPLEIDEIEILRRFLFEYLSRDRDSFAYILELIRERGVQLYIHSPGLGGRHVQVFEVEEVQEVHLHREPLPQSSAPNADWASNDPPTEEDLEKLVAAVACGEPWAHEKAEEYARLGKFWALEALDAYSKKKIAERRETKAGLPSWAA